MVDRDLNQLMVWFGQIYKSAKLYHEIKKSINISTKSWFHQGRKPYPQSIDFNLIGQKTVTRVKDSAALKPSILELGLDHEVFIGFQRVWLGCGLMGNAHVCNRGGFAIVMVDGGGLSPPVLIHTLGWWVACWMFSTAILSVTKAKPPRYHSQHV